MAMQSRLVAVLVTLMALVASLGGAQAQAPPPADAPRITAEELKSLVAKGDAVLVDVRTQAAWDFGHIEGAIHIPLSDIPSRLRELPKDKLIACYCT